MKVTKERLRILEKKIKATREEVETTEEIIDKLSTSTIQEIVRYMNGILGARRKKDK